MVTPRLIGTIVLIGAFCVTLLLSVSRIASILCYPFIVMQSYVIDPIKRHITGRLTSVQELQSALDDLMARHVRLQATIDFQQDARDVIAFQERYMDGNYCIAQVLERHMSDMHYILLDKGARDGVKIDSIVVYKDMLVGKITNVYPLYARCMLITDRQCKVGGYVVNSRVSGVMQGAGDGTLHLLHVSHLEKVNVDDFVFSSGAGLIFPRGFGIGQVVSIEREGLMLDIRCKPLIDISQIMYCAIFMH
jgi:rod shape-determining protein MreC